MVEPAAEEVVDEDFDSEDEFYFADAPVLPQQMHQRISLAINIYKPTTPARSPVEELETQFNGVTRLLGGEVGFRYRATLILDGREVELGRDFETTTEAAVAITLAQLRHARSQAEASRPAPREEEEQGPSL